MTIRCTDLDNFLDTIQGLTIRGLTFTADTYTFQIKLTGGF